MATVEKIFLINTYEVDAVSWTGHLTLIDELGIAQLQVYFRTNGDTAWTKIEKNSYSSTYNSSAETVDLTGATKLVDGSSTPVNLDKTQHDIKIERETSASLYFSFQEGSKLSGKDLNVVNLQAIHKLEEEAARLDEEDQDIYSHISTQLQSYYTKTEVDQFFRGLTLPNWSSGRDYIVGDTVLHDDPNTDATTLLIWYCGVAHTSTAGTAPSATGGGAAYWTNVAPGTSLDNLNYIRKLPGLSSTPNDWNTITTQNASALGLSIRPFSSQSADVFNITKQDHSSISLRFASGTGSGITTHDRLTLEDAYLQVKDKSYLGHDGSSTTHFNFTTSSNPTLSIPAGSSASEAAPVIGIASRSQQDTLQAFDLSDALKLKIDSDLVVTSYSNNLYGVSFKYQSPYKVIFESSDDFTGTGLFSGDEVISHRPFKFGFNTGTSSDPFTTTLTLFPSTGNITSSGTITSGEFKDTTLANATYLSADANGVIQKETGSIPSTSRIAYNVTGSNTSLSDGDVVYLDSTTQVWTKAVRTDSTKLAVGVIDDKSGSDGNQSFNVIFSGVVDGYTGLTIGNWCWLDSTAGGITQTAPTAAGSIIDPVGIALTATSIMVMPARPHQLPS